MFDDSLSIKVLAWWPEQLLFPSFDDILRNAILFGLSATLVLLVLVILAGIYRANNADLPKPVSLTLFAAPGNIVFAPKHLQHPRVHEGKSPLIEYWIELGPSLKKKAATVPAKIQIRKNNSHNIHDQTYTSAIEGGQIGIDDNTRDQLEAFAQQIYNKEGRKISVDTDRFSVKLVYPSRFNLVYLLREHPDTSVRVSAWVFILTSLFAVFQSILLNSLGFA